MWAGWVHHSRRFGHAEALCEVGPEMPERRSKMSMCQSSEQLLVFLWLYPNDFLSRLVTMDETWLYHYDLKTKQQSMEWQHSGSPCPKKIPSAKIHWKSSCLDFLESRWHPPHWGSSKGPNYQRGVLLISAGATEGSFEGKTMWESHQGGLVLAWQCPSSPGTCDPEEAGLPGLPCLEHPPYSLDLAALDYHLFSGQKKELNSRHFSSNAEVTAAAETWLNGQHSEFFLSGLQS